MKTFQLSVQNLREIGWFAGKNGRIEEWKDGGFVMFQFPSNGKVLSDWHSPVRVGSVKIGFQFPSNGKALSDLIVGISIIKWW